MLSRHKEDNHGLWEEIYFANAIVCKYNASRDYNRAVINNNQCYVI